MEHLTLEKLALRIAELRLAAVRARLALEPVLVREAGHDEHAPPPGEAEGWRVLDEGAPWGRFHGCVWLRAELSIPEGWRALPLELCLRYPLIVDDDTFRRIEANLYLDGALYAGIDHYHRSVLLPADLGDGPHEIAILVYTRELLAWEGLELHLRDEVIWRLGERMRTLLGAFEQLPAHSLARHALLAVLNQAYKRLDLRAGWASDALAESARAALGGLEQDLRALPAAGARPRIVASGHAHMDVAWLWPLWRTRQKIPHTVATALRLMERYPDYHFSMSQPQTYAYLKQDQPALYAQLKQRVAEGRFEPVGTMWVEADCNLTSGESLIRQILHGREFFAQEFGLESQVCWLPDVFGYSAALPQILRGCGIAIFMTTKLSWNQTNRFPHDTFRWCGIDGSAILAHLITAPTPGSATMMTYNGNMEPWQLAGLWQSYRQQHLNHELLYLFGVGDGGGGPTEGMLEAAQVLADLPDFPQLRLGRAKDYFEALCARVYERPELPTWVGELYLEYHRGTYTSQGFVKWANRRSELLFREAEWLAAWASQHGAPARQAELDAGWKLILLNQFHDILPGSSIAEVYRDARAHYQQIFAVGEQIVAESIETLAGTLSLARPSLIAINTLPWERQDVALLPLGEGEALEEGLARIDGDVEPLIVQVVEQHGVRHLLLDALSVPSYGYRAYEQVGARAPSVGSALGAGPRQLESPLYLLELDEQGEITRLYDKRFERELLLPGQRGNQLIAFEDRPLRFDAWDIDPFYVEKPYPLGPAEQIRVLEAGPVRATLEITRRYGRSAIVQRLSLYRSLPRIDFATEIDWRERQTLLKAAFPLALNTSTATHEIQFGSVERPTHRNNSWDAARFETCAHKWVDLSEGGYGVALLNDGKYGHDTLGSTLRLTLLKSGIMPDPSADEGQHRFTYALLPHGGDWRQAEVVRRAYELNVPLRLVRRSPQEGMLPASGSFMRCNADHVVVETVKAAQDGQGLIVRLYEAHNQRGSATLSFHAPLRQAHEADMLERPLRELAPEGQRLRVELRPFEVKTLRLQFGEM
jgi:alpha-mannosidase